MKVVVFGSNKKTLSEVVRQGLKLGLEITLFIKERNTFNIIDPNLNIVEGSLLDKEAIREAIRGQYAVIACFNNYYLSKKNDLYSIINNIVSGMKKENVGRILYMSTLIVNNCKQGIKGWFIYKFAGKIIQSHKKCINLIYNSNLEYTILKTPLINSNVISKKLKVITERNNKDSIYINKKDIVYFLFQIIIKVKFTRENISLIS